MFKNNYYTESHKIHSFIHSFILPVFSGSCTAGLGSGPGLKWWLKQKLQPPGVHDLLHKAAEADGRDADAPSGLVLKAISYFCVLLPVHPMCVPVLSQVVRLEGNCLRLKHRGTLWNVYGIAQDFAHEWRKKLEGGGHGVEQSKMPLEQSWLISFSLCRFLPTLKLENRMREE